MRKRGACALVLVLSLTTAACSKSDDPRNPASPPSPANDPRKVQDALKDCLPLVTPSPAG